MTAPRPTGSRLCVIHGNSLPKGADPVEGKRVTVDAGGDFPVEATDGGDIVGIPRHGFDRSIPAHLVDHRANIRAACDLGCNRVLALASVGSLDKDLKVGMLICPEDFYAPETAPSFYRDPRGHSVPGFDPDWRDIVISAWGSLTDTELEVGGTYAQTIGPRFETPAEVRALAEVADMVGMTIAAETVLTGEAALAYAAVCTVDNLANGISDKQLTVDEYRRGRDRTARTLAADLKFVLPALAKGLPGS
ncbi:MAG TPA: MTAP family purine nucleoside phosphorylase [Solirubrobacterales bacterium]|nr:MTAP family purine nucleoside phosphorylase [Solirubrobacterales bacterium]